MNSEPERRISSFDRLLGQGSATSLSQWLTGLLPSIVWRSDPELSRRFDWRTTQGLDGFAKWWRRTGRLEYGLDRGPTGTIAWPDARYFRARNLVRSLNRRYRPAFAVKFAAVAERMVVAGLLGLLVAARSAHASRLRAGVNLIGYAKANLGMGEHVRMSAAALEGGDVAFGTVSVDLGVKRRQLGASAIAHEIAANIFDINLFHINADQMLPFLGHVGPDFFSGRYNIGFWAWELADFPDRWVPLIELLDEVWAPSQFVQRAVAAKTTKPVITMPLCVSLPRPTAFSFAGFDIPTDSFKFLTTLDYLSHVERKNPVGAIKAFQHAFPDPRDRTTLIVKTMNEAERPEDGAKVRAAAAGDRRIVFIDRPMSREAMIGLIDGCDCYVSLHRSEGFGRGPAEAMALGKPVILTDYSGTTEFANGSNSLPIDYRMVAVAKGDYPCAEGQEWADPDLLQAAQHMRTIFGDRALAAGIGAQAASHMARNFGPEATRNRYLGRFSLIRDGKFGAFYERM